MIYFYLLIALLVLCFIQDVKYRGIHWIIFPLLLLGAFMTNSEFLWSQIFNNFLFIGFTLSMLTLYLSIKEQRFVKITSGYFSLGDILFLLAVIPLFSFQEYIYFFTFGTIITIIFHLIASIIKVQKTVPYAGYMSVVSIGFLFFENQINHYLLF